MAKGLAVLTAFLVASLLLVASPTEARTSRAQDKWSYGIWIFSPTNTTYTTNQLLLNITAKRNFDQNYYNTQLKYNLNGTENITIPATDTYVDMSIPGTIFSGLASYTLFSGTIALPKIPEGTYCLTVYGVYNRAQGVDPKYPNMYDIQTIYFTINRGIPPTITLLQFRNVTSEKSLSLNFTVDKPVSWMGYCFDRRDNVTVSGNFTLPELAYGMHNVTVYAQDSLGNQGASETAYFKVVKAEKIEPWLFGVLAAGIFGFFITAALFKKYLPRKARKQDK